ncbi:phosphoenolpyruvate carboxykinase (ATP) [Candidatus Peribacteria bacterium RIFCSPHIGHO2_02_FULL_55_24]|nr:MAG: phosphoenolpyruvate carboxykinase (ATP) [Candidatus Peribacteria bacterium RIFCSPHIGHO2_02_FULL_55_24]
MTTVATNAVQALLQEHPAVSRNPSRAAMIQATLDAREAFLTSSGALATWGPAACTGRIPQDTYIVRHGCALEACDWGFSACNPMEIRVFDQLWDDAISLLERKTSLYVTERSVGAEKKSTFPVRTVTDSPLVALFTDNMFRTACHGEPFTLLVLPHDRAMTASYDGVLRKSAVKTVDMLVAMDFERMRGLVYGTSYLGCVKKLLFTTMNFLLPEQGILPLHCAANRGNGGDTALFLGLSGTGKTTLSTDPNRSMIGDDEHLWSDHGIANMEGGCYAKLAHLRREKEPEIYEAVFGMERGVIIENAMMYPDGSFDLDDERLTENSRASYPLSFLPRIVKEGCAGHPRTVLFLTADAQGVLPPIAKLGHTQVLLWFLMGYTSKLAGTEAGVTRPKTTFSRFFGGPFMPRMPMDYLSLFKKKLLDHGTDVYLVNTGWSGGAYGVGKRMDIALTRRLVDAALSGKFCDVPYWEYQKFHLLVPKACPGVDPKLLNPKLTWADPDAYDRAAEALAQEFSAMFEKEFAGKVSQEIAKVCPGK